MIMLLFKRTKTNLSGRVSFALFRRSGRCRGSVSADYPGRLECGDSDMSMPGRSGLDALTQIQAIAPHIPVLIMSMYPEDQYAIRVLKAGAAISARRRSTTILSGRSDREPREKIHHPHVYSFANALGEDHALQPHESLSDREFDVFKLLAGGKAKTEIRKSASQQPTTVSTYRSRS